MSIVDFFNDYESFIIMIHITSAIIWIGASFIFVASIFPSLMQIPNDRMITRTTIRILYRYLKITFGFSFLLVFSGMIIVIAKNLTTNGPLIETIIYTKGYIWIAMTSLYVYALVKIKSARNICFHGDTLRAIASLKAVTNYAFTLNVLLGLIAIYFGIMLRG